MKNCFLLIFSFFLVSGAGAEEACSINSVFQVPLSCFYLKPNGKPSGAVLLLHMLGRRKEDYSSLANFLHSSNFCTLAFDLPGHPKPYESKKKEGALDWRDMRESDFKKMVIDVEFAAKKMKEVCEWNGAISIIGSELGANLAAFYAFSAQDVQKLIFISPGLNIKGLDIYTLFKNKSKPLPKILIISDTGHIYFYYSALKLIELLGESANSFFVKRNLLGTYLLQGVYGVEEKILEFLKQE